MAIFTPTSHPAILQDENGAYHIDVPGEGPVPMVQGLHDEMIQGLQNSPQPQTGAGGPPMAQPPISGDNIVPAAPSFEAPPDTNVQPRPNVPVDSNGQPFAARTTSAPTVQSAFPKLTTEESKTESKSISSAAQTAQNKAIEAAHLANAADLQAHAASVGAQAAITQKYADDIANDNADYATAEAARQETLNDKLKDVDRVTSDYENMKVDPNHYFGSMDTAGKFAAGIGIMLSGLGAGLTGPNAPNLALQQVNKAIDNDIEAQKANIAKAGNVAAAQRGALQDYREAAGDERAGEHLERARLLDAFSNELKNVDIQNMPAELAAHFQAQDAAIQQQSANEKAAASTIINSKIKSEKPFLPSGQAAAAQLAGRDMLSKIEDMKKLVADPETRAGMGRITGTINAWKSQEGIPSNPKVDNMISEMRNLGIEVARDATGRFNETELKEIQKTLPGPGMSPEVFMNRLNNYKHIVERKVQQQQALQMGGSMSPINGGQTNTPTYDQQNP